MKENVKLCQIIAVEKGVKSQANRDYTDLHHNVQKTALLSGISRSYTPTNDDGEVFPSENNRVQLRAKEVLKQVEDILTRLFDITATKDFSNCSAKSDIVLDQMPPRVIAKDVPVTTLLFLEKQLTDLGTFIRKIPSLDPSEEWKFDTAQDCYSSVPVQTVKTRKEAKVIQKAKATEQHPEQTELVFEDKIIGHWKTIKYSGALPQQEINTMLNRVETLSRAVKFAREAANQTPVQDKKIAKEIFAYLFKG